MGLRFLEHVLILTHDPEGTRDGFCHNLGFRHAAVRRGRVPACTDQG
jgi:hypothetical protein